MKHRKKIKHYHEPGHLHEFTFSTYQQKPLLADESRLEMLARALDAANEQLGVDLVAFVFMPEHVHLLTYPRSEDPNFGLYLARIKQPFSKQVKELLTQKNSSLLAELNVRERPGKYCFRFWQEGAGFDRNLFSPSAISASIDYIHSNPVTRQLCKRATDWKWSSAAYYLNEPPGQQDPLLPIVHGPPTGCLD